jgi:hypothetical protein
VPERTFAAIPNIATWKNVSPRFGASYDLFGNGRTAIKGNVGAYVQSQGTGFAATYNPVVISTDVRTWTDTNRDDIAQESELGPTSNRTFGVRSNQNPANGISRSATIAATSTSCSGRRTSRSRSRRTRSRRCPIR